MIAADSVPFTSSVVGVVTALATLITAVTALAAVLPTLFKLRRDVKAVHTIVNQQRTDMQRYERALIAALKAAGVEVPVDQSIDPKER